MGWLMDKHEEAVGGWGLGGIYVMCGCFVC